MRVEKVFKQLKPPTDLSSIPNIYLCWVSHNCLQIWLYDGTSLLGLCGYLTLLRHSYTQILICTYNDYNKS